jgi:hypothetical protein
MSGTVDIFTETLDRAVVVPIQAVTVRDFNEVRRRPARRWTTSPARTSAVWCSSSATTARRWWR